MAGNLLENSLTSFANLTRFGYADGPFSRADLKSFSLLPVSFLISNVMSTALWKKSATWTKSSSVNPLDMYKVVIIKR